MQISPKDLSAAYQQGIITEQQAASLWSFIESNAGNRTRFNFTHLLYFLGGLIAISAMTLFMNLSWEKFGYQGLLVLSLIYIGCSSLAAETCLRRKLPIPMALLACFSISLMPLFAYSIMKYSGLWPDSAGFPDYLHPHDSGHAYAWLALETTALAWSLLMLWRFRHPLLVLPLIIISWFLLLDIIGLTHGAISAQQLRNIGIGYGLLLFICSIVTDLYQPDDDFGFWFCMTGLLLFWISLSLSDSSSEIDKAIYCFINLLLLLAGVVLQRPIAVLLGAAGITFYLGHLAYDLFRDNWLFPLALSFIGLALLYGGILWHRKGQNIRNHCQQWLPEKLQQAINHRR